jgi:hypothetical protein
MNLFGFDVSIKRNKAPGSLPPESGWQLRPTDGQGPYTRYFSNYIPRKVEASFYEFLREAIPLIDAAINRLISLDGHIEVEGDNAALVEEIKEWLYNVPVNDVQKGLQAFHQNQTNEAFEQGFGLGEFVANRQRSDIVQLRVADSKFIKFERKTGQNGGLTIYQKADNDTDYRELKQDSLLYFSIHNENQNPYGTPLFRSCEFVAKVLATMHNSLLNVWERFGDPSFQILYKTSKRDGGELEKRRKTIETEFSQALRAKKKGQSADFVRAVDTSSDIIIKVIGADGQVLDLEVPARHVAEQIIAKSGLPPWMLGMHWSTTERLADSEVEILLADVATRQAAKMPHFYNLIRNLLLLRGRSWKKGDWALKWAQVNLRDVLKQAQARFMNAQADMYYLQNAEAAGIQLERGDLSIGKSAGTEKIKLREKGAHRCSDHLPLSGAKELSRPAPWPALDTLEDEYTARLKDDWAKLRDSTLLILKLVSAADIKLPEPGEKADPPTIDTFTYTAEQRAAIMAAMRNFIGIYDIADPDSPVLWYYGQAYSLGLIQAAELSGAERPILDIIKNSEVYDELCANGFQLVKDDATRAITKRIMPEMEAQMLAGTNPRHVGDRLRSIFDNANSDWERLARSEMTMAAELAKGDEWSAWGIERLEFVPAPDACPMCQALAGDYPIDQCPLPVRDTHPRCRCSRRPAEENAG